MATQHIEHDFVDPVCRMKVARDSKVPNFTLGSVTYHFCADACRKAFIADPDKYLKAKPAKRKGFWGRYVDRVQKATGGKPPCCH
ncbi:MAG: YHS domain-containing protein [Deltaproteobacteria bacterium]|nr:YHS domain-containing protein [Deltaproteobacteria bacterium]